MGTWRKLSGLIAALTLAGMGLLAFPMAPFLSSMMMIGGLGIAAWQSWLLWTNRSPSQDPYDLNRLWEMPEQHDEPDPELDPFVREGSSLLCRHCGEAVSGDLKVCPVCKNFLV
jgi:hypothetical protein